MRIPANHFLLHQYLTNFGLADDLFDFEMENKFIYISGFEGPFGGTMTYQNFNDLLTNGGESEESKKLLALFPGLHDKEKKKTCDDLFGDAVQDVGQVFAEAYKVGKTEPEKIKNGYAAITKEFDKYSLRSYLTERAGWSPDAINLYDLGNAHVVFENGFIESFKDAFLSSNNEGKQAQMQQLQQGMDAVPNAFVSSARGKGNKPDSIIRTAWLMQMARFSH